MNEVFEVGGDLVATGGAYANEIMWRFFLCFRSWGSIARKLSDAACFSAKAPTCQSSQVFYLWRSTRAKSMIGVCWLRAARDALQSKRLVEMSVAALRSRASKGVFDTLSFNAAYCLAPLCCRWYTTCYA